MSKLDFNKIKIQIQKGKEGFQYDCLKRLSELKSACANKNDDAQIRELYALCKICCKSLTKCWHSQGKSLEDEMSLRRIYDICVFLFNTNLRSETFTLLAYLLKYFEVVNEFETISLTKKKVCLGALNLHYKYLVHEVINERNGNKKENRPNLRYFWLNMVKYDRLTKSTFPVNLFYIYERFFVIQNSEEFLECSFENCIVIYGEICSYYKGKYTEDNLKHFLDASAVITHCISLGKPSGAFMSAFSTFVDGKHRNCLRFCLNLIEWLASGKEGLKVAHFPLLEGEEREAATVFALVTVSRKCCHFIRERREVEGKDLELLNVLDRVLDLIDETRYGEDTEGIFMINLRKRIADGCLHNIMVYFLHLFLKLSKIDKGVLTEYVGLVKRVLQTFFYYVHWEKKRTGFIEGEKFGRVLNAGMPIAVLQFNEKFYKECLEISLSLLKNAAEFPIDMLRDPSLQMIISKIVFPCCYSYKHLGKFLEAMTTACVWCIFSPQNSNVFLDIFVSIKADGGDENLSNKTFWNILVENNKETKREWPAIKVAFQKKNLSDWLLRELEAYKRNLKSYSSNQNYYEKSLEAISSIKNLMENCMERKLSVTVSKKVMVYLGIIAFLLAIEENEPGKIGGNIPEVESLLLNLQQMLEGLRRKCRPLMKNLHDSYSYLMGNFHYVKYRLNLLHQRSKNNAELKCLKKDNNNGQIAMEENDSIFMENDDNLNYGYFTYGKQMELLHILDEALKSWGCLSLTYDNKDDEKKMDTDCNINLDCTLEYVKECAMLYRLCRQTAKEEAAWNLLYNLARETRCDNAAVFAFSNLLHCKYWSMNDSLKTEVEGMVARLSDQELEFRYHLGWAERFLLDGKLEQGLKAFLSMKLLEPGLDAFGLLRVKYRILETQYEFYAYNKFEVAEKNSPSVGKVDHVLANVYQAYISAIRCAKNNNFKSFAECSELQCLLMDVSSFAASVYFHACKNRVAWAFYKSQMDLAQKLGLPIRICEMLIGLAELDISRCASEAIYPKLRDIRMMMENGEESDEVEAIKKKRFRGLIPRRMPEKSPVTTNPYLLISREVSVSHNLIDGEREGLLSQEQGREEWKQFLEFTWHGTECSCPPCQDAHYQVLCVRLLILRADYYMLKEIFHGARKHFQSILGTIVRLQTSSACRHSPAITGEFWSLDCQVSERLALCSSSLKAYEIALTVLSDAESYYEHLPLKDPMCKVHFSDLRQLIRFASFRMKENKEESSGEDKVKGGILAKIAEKKAPPLVVKTPAKRKTVEGDKTVVKMDGTPRPIRFPAKNLCDNF